MEDGFVTTSNQEQMERTEDFQMGLQFSTSLGWADHRRAFSHYAVGRLTQYTDPEIAIAQFRLADRFYAQTPGAGLHRAHRDVDIPVPGHHHDLGRGVKLPDPAQQIDAVVLVQLVVEDRETRRILRELRLEFERLVFSRNGIERAAGALRCSAGCTASCVPSILRC